MNWVDPKYWKGEKTYGTEQINALITHFEVPLKADGFDSKATFKEWRYGCRVFTVVEKDFYPQKKGI